MEGGIEGGRTEQSQCGVRNKQRKKKYKYGYLLLLLLLSFNFNKDNLLILLLCHQNLLSLSNAASTEHRGNVRGPCPVLAALGQPHPLSTQIEPTHPPLLSLHRLMIIITMRRRRGWWWCLSAMLAY